jgi:uncharacterized protein YbcI
MLEAMVQEVTGVRPVRMHHDISTVTGEEVVLFALAESPEVREPKRPADAQGRSTPPMRGRG